MMPRGVALAVCVLSFASTGRAEEAEKVTVCQLKSDPAAFNHKLVEVTALISHGFENFTLVDPDCPAEAWIWIEYGGTNWSNTIYCCGSTANGKRPGPLLVEDIPISLVRDENFQAFDAIVQRPYDTLLHATIAGRFFAGEQDRAHNPGYGHLGCCSLLVIQQVLAVDSQNRKDLDYSDSTGRPNVKLSCRVSNLRPEDYTWRTAQQTAESGQTAWAFDNPRRVASEGLAGFLGIDPKTIVDMKQKRKAQGRFVYEWKPKGQKKTYQVMVSRPYFLTLYAKDPQRVAWVIAAARSWCD